MRHYVFDENCSAAKLVRACTSEGKCVIQPHPAYLRSKLDHEFIEEVLAGPATFITNDYTIIEENLGRIPAENSGAIVLKLRGTSLPITTSMSATLLKHFKQHFPCWSETSLNGIYLTITEVGVFVAPLSSQLPHPAVLRFDATNFAILLSGEIANCQERRVSTSIG